VPVTLRISAPRITYPRLLYAHFDPGLKARGIAAARLIRARSVYAAEIEAVGIVGGARRVGEKMPDGDPLPPWRRLGKMPGDPGVERQATLLDEHHHGGSRELLADGSRLEHGGGLDGNLMLDIGEPVPLRQHDLPSLHDRDRHAGHMLPGHFAGDIGVDAVREAVLRSRDARRQRDEQQ
jgi:hypothetical protein